MFLKTKLPEHGRKPRETTVADVDPGILLSDHFEHPDNFERNDEEMGEDDGGYETAHGKVNYEYIEEA